ncbi:glycosyltransferase family 2 protein, partial [Burkholderia cenocepacia]|nr:glycosyltransferase family 2 protein [Burkholderia cenocepacia]
MASFDPPPPGTPGIPFDPELLLMPCVAYLWLFTLLTCGYAARHYLFSLDRLFKPQHA